VTSRLQAIGITKRFPGVVALDEVDFSVEAGEVHALLGENGAGKSTLVRIIAGDYEPDAGELMIDGEPVTFGSARDARSHGVRIVTQERSLVPSLSVTENVLMGRLPRRPRSHIIAWKDAHRRAREALAPFGLDHLDPARELGQLRPAHQQLVEIARAISEDGRILILDEPTAALAAEDADHLFEAVRGLRDRGVGIVYISHRFGELAEIADSVTILRDGKLIETRPFGDATPAELVRAMVGRDIESLYPRVRAAAGEVLFSLRDVTAPGICEAATLEVRAGEVVGVFGLVGSGATEIPYVAAGAIPAAGTVDRRVPHALVPSDRRAEGILPQASVARNIALASLSRYRRGAAFSHGRERAAARARADQLAIRTANLETTITKLSGGNQQKAIVGRGLELGAGIYFLSEPTRGVDVGARADIYGILADRCASGAGVLLASSDLDEVVGLADRVYVMSRRRIVANVVGSEITSERLLAEATR
jgi:ABC-type sugar transport system ATPase subunit